MLLANYSKDVSSEIDNKRLTEFPQFGQKGFNDRLEQYVEDRVGLRVPAITLYQYLCDRMFHVLVHPAYMYGKGNEIYSPVDLTAYQNLDVEDKYIESVSDYLTGLADLCGDSNADLIFFMCPNKESVYYENFPEGYNIKDQPFPKYSDSVLESSGQRTLSQRDKLTGECYRIVLSGTLLTLELSPSILWNWTLLDFGFFTKHTLDWMVGK